MDLKSTLIEVEKSYDRLVQSRSCAHDSEFLSRQENTLQAVHEKLEASLSGKDKHIERLQTEVPVVYRVVVGTGVYTWKGDGVMFTSYLLL